MNIEKSENVKNKSWNYQPDLPILNSPLFDWTPRPSSALKWVLNRWIKVTSSTLFLIVAILVYNIGQTHPRDILGLGTGLDLSDLGAEPLTSRHFCGWPSSLVHYLLDAR